MVYLDIVWNIIVWSWMYQTIIIIKVELRTSTIFRKQLVSANLIIGRQFCIDCIFRNFLDVGN